MQFYKYFVKGLESIAGWRIKHIFRRRNIILKGLSSKKCANSFFGLLNYFQSTSVLNSWPLIIKVDTTPLCQLRCPICIHTKNPLFEKQVLKSDFKMSLNTFETLLNQVADYIIGMSMHYLGDPFMNCDLLSMCSMANERGVSTYVNTNFSFKFSDEMIFNIVKSGLSVITICVDGFTQETYEKNRVGGNLSLVLNNLKRLVKAKKESKSVTPFIEIQSLIFDYNRDEIELVREMVNQVGVDQFDTRMGEANITYADMSLPRREPMPPNRILPKCFWPWFQSVVKWNGDVIPCCNYRLVKQYTSDLSESRSLGNIHSENFFKIWNNRSYQLLRKQCSNPIKSYSDPEMKNNFCNGCPFIYK